MANGCNNHGKQMSKLTEKQEQFCQEYVKDFNATRAYMRVFKNISYDSARVESCKLLTNPNIRTCIDKLKEDISEQHKNMREKIIAKYERIAFTPVIDFLEENDIEFENGRKARTYILKDFKDIPWELKDIVKSITPAVNGWRVEFLDPQVALDALRKMLGLDAPIKTELTGKNGEDLNINIVVK